MNLNITHSGRFNYKQNTGVSSHYQHDYQIQLIYSGTGTSKVNDDSFLINTGDIVFVKKGSTHEFFSNKNVLKTLEIKFLCEDPNLCKIIDGIEAITKNTNRSFTDLIEKIVLEGQRKSLYYKQVSEAYLAQFILLLARYDNTLHSKNMVDDKLDSQRINHDECTPILNKIHEYLQNNINREFSIEELSKFCGYNKDYLYRLVKKTTGISLIQYINNLKLEEAKKLMKYSELHTTEIAYNLGFSSIQYFSRFFKKYMGISPSEYTDSVRSSTRTDYE